MHPALQVIERNLSQFSADESCLVINPPEEWQPLSVGKNKLVTLDYRVFTRVEQAGADEIEFGLSETSEGTPYDCVLLFMSKSKSELSMLLSYACASLSAEGRLMLVGAKKEGIGSAAKVLPKFFERTFKVDSAKHCQLWCASQPLAPKPFELDEWFRYFEYPLEGRKLELATLPGVFSHEKLDLGTQIFLDRLKEHIKEMEGRVLDFGCGSGVIGLVAACLKPEITLEMTDISWLAIKSAERSAELNNIDAQVSPSDGWSDVNGRFNTILSNPPFHSGVKTEYVTTETFIRDSWNHMAKHARLIIVANTFLRYSPIIEQQFGNVVSIHQDPKFSVYLTKRT